MNHILLHHKCLFAAKCLFVAFLPGFIGFAQTAAAQDIVTQNTTTTTTTTTTTPATENHAKATENQANQTDNAAVPETDKSEKSETARQMLAFFDGMIAAVDAQTGNCEAMSKALQTYYHEHQAWISSLDYATGNLDAETMAAVHEKAVAFGKKLSVCYDQKSIPSQLHRYAGMGEEFE